MGVPKFVKINDTALRLRGNSYYRDAGNWSVDYKVIDGVLVSWYWTPRKLWLHRKPLIEITKEEWVVSNGEFAPKHILEENEH